MQNLCVRGADLRKGSTDEKKGKNEEQVSHDRTFLFELITAKVSENFAKGLFKVAGAQRLVLVPASVPL